MKTMKPMLIAVLMASMSAFGQEAIVNQINITQDAVNVALEEFKQGKEQIEDSSDAQKKKAAFNAAATQALVAFEETVRTRVLKSFTSLVTNYNSTLKNRALGDARGEVLNNLLIQMNKMVEDKSVVYRQAYLELYKVMPDLPIVYFRGKNNYAYTDAHQTNPVCMSAMFNCGWTHIYKNDVLFSRSGIHKLSTSSEKEYSQLEIVYKDDQGIKKNTVRTSILEGCFTSTCFFTTQTMYTVWRSMIERTLTRQIEIRLDDGTALIIKKDATGYESDTILKEVLNDVKVEGLITDLPYEISSERLASFEAAQGELTKGNCKKAQKTLAGLCQSTREGCLQPSEVTLLKDRFGSKASCLK